MMFFCVSVFLEMFWYKAKHEGCCLIPHLLEPMKRIQTRILKDKWKLKSCMIQRKAIYKWNTFKYHLELLQVYHKGYDSPVIEKYESRLRPVSQCASQDKMEVQFHWSGFAYLHKQICRLPPEYQPAVCHLHSLKRERWGLTHYGLKPGGVALFIMTSSKEWNLDVLPHK